MVKITDVSEVTTPIAMKIADAMKEALIEVLRLEGPDRPHEPAIVIAAICDLTYQMDEFYSEPIRRIAGVQLSRELGKLR